LKNTFKRLVLHESEKADETWVNLDHVVAITPDPEERFMVVVLNVVVAFSSRPKIYKITVECGRELLGI
jgi:hypothetical protein